MEINVLCQCRFTVVLVRMHILPMPGFENKDQLNCSTEDDPSVSTILPFFCFVPHLRADYLRLSCVNAKFCSFVVPRVVNAPAEEIPDVLPSWIGIAMLYVFRRGSGFECCSVPLPTSLVVPIQYSCSNVQ